MTENVAKRAIVQDLFLLKRDRNAQLYSFVYYSLFSSSLWRDLIAGSNVGGMLHGLREMDAPAVINRSFNNMRKFNRHSTTVGGNTHPTKDFSMSHVLHLG